jgi:N-acetyl-anhydromuramyl-L-alanine amidase AmpD
VPAHVVTAFRRHWHPERVGGEADAETLARAAALARMVGG